MIQLSAVRIEGGLFSADLFEQILAEEIEGQKPADFGLEGKRTVREAIDTAYTEAQGLWAAYQQLREKDPEKAEDTTATRTRWVVPFLKLLGYSPTLLRSGYNLDGVIYAISHTAEKGPAAPPIHIIALNKDLDKVDPSGRPRFAPHTLMQEYLNRTEESLWGIITNGRTIRLLRDSTYLRKQAYVEFDLEAIFEKGLYNDFALLYRLLHRSRLPKGGQHVHDCVLERYYHSSIEQGGRIREGLRKGVERAILILANGLLQQNPQLQEAVFPETKVKHPYTAADLYADLLRIVYRIIFLLVAEDRKLVGDQEIYREFYSLSRFRKYIANRAHYNEHKDLWISLNSLWQILRDERGEAAKALGLSVLDGDLFRPIPIESYDLDNRTLLEAMSCLLRWEDEETRTVRNVNYGALDVEELGSVYESLLENHPRIDPTARQFDFDQGAERKSTGSYYTPSSLVHELIQSALAPVVERRLKGLKEKEEQEQAILSISVVDPACGSGHFLLAAARYLAKRLAQIRVGKEEEPPPSLFREAVRDVVSHCIYGVDLNPLAAELCKVALWIETNTGDKPLTFLDHHIKCGNALLGILDPDIIEDGIPDEAYKPVSGDQKDLARKVRNLNAAFLATKQLTLGFEEVATDNAEAVRLAQELHAIRDDSLDGIHAKQRKHDQLQKTIEQTKCVYDLYTAAFFQRRAREEEETEGQEDLSRFITSETVHKARTGSLMPGKGPAAMESLADKHRFFHWPLEFPEVFAKGGFDVVLGNPPWERIKLQEREFFAARDPKIADAGNAAERKKLIRQLEDTNPALYEEFQDAVHAAEATSRFLRYSREYPLTARGDINTYSVFAERMRRLRREEGRAGIIVPTGIATDDTNKKFFADLVEKKELVSLYDFDNRMKLFPAVISLMKFCLLTMGIENERTLFAFFCHQPEDIRDPNKRIVLSPGDITLLNPNTRTLPVFRTRQDAELTKAIYERVPVLVRESPQEKPEDNPWGVSFLRMFDMANDSGLFRTPKSLKSAEQVGNRLLLRENRYLPLYEAKMIWHYDHRYGTYEGAASRSSTQLPTPSEEQHADPAYLVQPWYWVEESEVLQRTTAYRTLVHALQSDDFYDLAQELAAILFPFYLLFEAKGETDAEKLEPIRLRVFELWREFVDCHPFLRKVNPQLALPLGVVSAEKPDSVSPDPVPGCLPSKSLDELEKDKAAEWRPVLPDRLAEALAERKSGRLRRVLEVAATKEEHVRYASERLGWRVEPLAGIQTKEQARAAAWLLIERAAPRWFLGFRNVTNPTNERTAVFSVAPRTGVGNSMPVLTHDASAERACCLYGNLASLPLDWVVRQKVAGVNMNFFYVEQLPILPPERYAPEDLLFLVPRVMELVYTAWDVKPFADDVWLDADEPLREAMRKQRRENREANGAPEPDPPDWLSAYPEIETDPQRGIPFGPFAWNADRRARLQAEVDAYFARLYGLTRKQLRYILDPADLTEKEREDLLSDFEEVQDPLDPAGYQARVLQNTAQDGTDEKFPWETFRVLKKNEIREFGEYRTRRLVLEAWARLRRG